MSSKVLRLEPLPAASDPAILIRAVTAIAAGARGVDALGAALELGAGMTQAYVDAAVFFGLVAPGPEMRLTPRGLTLSAADPRRRRRLLAQAIWHTPEAAEILRGSGPVLASARVAEWVRARQPSLPDHKVARLAEAAASLLAPALEFPTERRTRSDQLALPFASPPREAPPMAPRDAREEVLDVLRDEGEIPLARAAVLCAGPPGALAEELIREDLAERLGERLIARPRLSGLDPAPLDATEAPFLEVLDRRLGLCFPSSLAALSGGISAVNAGLRASREAREGAAALATDPRGRVHGGLLHPGERPPRSVPDGLTLRLRALQCTPAMSLLGAALVLERRSEGRLSLRADGSALRWRRGLVGTLSEAMAAFARAQGWVLFRPERGGLTDESWAQAAMGMGLASRVETRLVLEEHFFLRLEDDVEANLTLESLTPLVERLSQWLDARRLER